VLLLFAICAPNVHLGPVFPRRRGKASEGFGNGSGHLSCVSIFFWCNACTV
jgi:hypothetical protein